MTCTNCQHDNADEARFCAHCGAPLTPPATVAPVTHTPTAPAARADRSTTRAIVLAVLVLLLIAVGMIAAVQRIANKAATPAPGVARTTGRPDDSKGKPEGPQRGAQPAGNAGGRAFGTGVTGGPEGGKAPDSPAEVGPQVERHDKSSGDGRASQDAAGGGQAATAVAGFLGALSSAVGGAHRHDPVDFHTLEALFPSSLPGMQPATPDGNADETMSIKTTSAHVDFSGPNDARISLSIKDATAISGLAGLADMANADSSEQGDSYERTETIDGRSVHEKWDAAARHGELSVSVGQRFAVDVVGDHVDMDALKSALARIDLARLESMKDANPVAK